MKEFKNTGVLIPEKIAESDFIAGSKNSIKYKEVNKSGDWGEYLPIGEKQHSVYFDTMGCVSFSFLNVIETSLNYLMNNSLLPFSHFKFLKENGYFINNEINFSDRHLAKQSGTTNKGNYLTKVADTARHQGFLPQSDWDYPIDQRNPVFDWDDFYKEIPQELKDKALKFLDYFEIQYEWISTSPDLATNDEIQHHLKQAPLQLAAPVCPGWNSGEVVKVCDKKRAGHATTIYRLEDYIYDFDHYTPFIKRLALNYYTPWILKIVLIIKDSTMLKIIGDNITKNQFALGLDNKVRLIYNKSTLEEGHLAGSWNKNEVDWVDGIFAKYERGKDSIYLDNE